MNTPTPRTDKEANDASLCDQCVPADFARQLERELASTRSDLIFEHGGIHATAKGWALKYFQATEQLATARTHLELLAEQYKEQKDNYGGDFLWKKYEDESVLKNVMAFLEGGES